MVTTLGTATGAVSTSNVAPVPPAGMTTVAGNEMKSLSLFTSDTSTPPGGAGLSSVTLPTVELPPITASSPSATPQRIGNRPSELSCQPRPKAARTLPIVAPRTGTVVIGDTVTSVLPAGTTTVAGTSANGMSLARLMSAPPAGAGMVSVTRACVELPPETLLGSLMMWNISKPGGVAASGRTVKLCPADHGPKTSPCTARMRQKYVPGGKMFLPSSSGSGTAM